MVSEGEKEVMTTRRKFITWMITASAAFLAGSGLIALFKIIFPPERAFGAVEGESGAIVSTSELPVGSGIPFSYKGKAAVLIHLEEGFYAYDAICTHLGCVIIWDEEVNLLHCPCHAGFLDPRTGEVISGPIPLPAPKIGTEIREGEVFAV